MKIYDFDKNRNNIRIDLEDKLFKNKDKLKLLKEEYRNKTNDKEIFYMEEVKYDFMLIKNKIIGTKNLDSKNIYISYCNKDISCSKFENCNFNHIKFENCNFNNDNFSNCTFENCDFYFCNFEYDENNITLFENNCVFKNCNFYKSNMKNVVFVDTLFKYARFNFTNLRNSILSNCNIYDVTFGDCNLKSMKIINTNINILKFEDEFITKLDENTFFDFVKLKNKQKKDYEQISKSYKNISEIFEKNRLFNYSGEYYYIAKCLERKSLKGVEKAKSNLFYYVCGYGERPIFAIISSLEVVVIFAIIYMFTGLCINERIIHYNLNIIYYLSRKLMYMDFIDCFYFSLVTFTTVGYGDIFPIGYSVILSCIEMMVGVSMVGIWTATLARKITR